MGSPRICDRLANELRGFELQPDGSYRMDITEGYHWRVEAYSDWTYDLILCSRGDQLLVIHRGNAHELDGPTRHLVAADLAAIAVVNTDADSFGKGGPGDAR